MKRERDPTPEEFEKFLAWLDPDRDEAGRRFKLIHSRLIQIFASRGCIDGESLADEVINRVAVRIDNVMKNYSEPLRCCIGFVENVHREHLRDRKKQDAIKEPTPPRPTEELEREDECLRECLNDLEQSERDLVAQYFQGEKRAKINGRKKLASELKLTANALRIQAHRLRKRLLQCMRMCLDQT